MLVELVKVNKGFVIYPLKLGYNQTEKKTINKPKKISLKKFNTRCWNKIRFIDKYPKSFDDNKSIKWTIGILMISLSVQNHYDTLLLRFE